MLPVTASLALADQPASQITRVAQETGHALPACNGCPPFVAVPEPPAGMRRITHAAVYELTWSQYLPAVEDGSCQFPVRAADGQELTPDERRKFDLNWTATRLRLSDLACFKAWVQRQFPAGYTVDIPNGDEWIWLAKAGSNTVEISAETAVLLESERALGGYNRPPKISIPATDVRVLYCSPIARMRPNAWGLYDMVGHAHEITSGIKPLGKGRAVRIPVVELRGGNCLTPAAKVPIHTPANGGLDRDSDSVLPDYAVRLVIVDESARKTLDAD